MSFDPIGFVFPKNRIPVGGAGYTEPGKVITWDGDTTGLAALPYGEAIGYKVSDDVVDLSNVTKVVFEDGAEVPPIALRVENDGIVQILGNWDDPTRYPYVAVVPQDIEVEGYAVSKGTYFVEYIRSIEFAETVHTIDPKFLPGPKVIDLTKYTHEITSGMSESFNEIILTLFANGGGSQDSIDDDNFWDDVSTDRPLLFVIDAEALAPGVTIEAEANSVMRGNGAIGVIEFAFLVNVGGWSKVTVVFGANDNGASTITVVVEPLTVPGA